VPWKTSSMSPHGGRQKLAQGKQNEAMRRPGYPEQTRIRARVSGRQMVE
jgi:hypothetical protein